jgi:hypothetical protein
VAFGLAAAWAKYAQHVAAAVLPWFQAATTDSRAFSVFIASAGAGTSGGGAGGAAGGGASGAG